jgi:hypothetical protein
MTPSRGVRAIADTERSREVDVPRRGEGWEIGEPAAGKTTLEVRWIHPGRIPASVMERLGPFEDRIELREDHYLVDPWSPDLGVKVRGALELDLKAFRGSPGELIVQGGGGGRLELWEKWTFPLDAGAMPPSEAAGWLAVRKVRRRRSFRVADGHVAERPLVEVDEPGCSIELTEVTVGADVWWTIGLEASGDSSNRDRDLRATVDVLFIDPLPEALLDPANSMSYMQWLGSRRDPR